MTDQESNSDGALRQFLESARTGLPGLPEGCSITYDLKTVDILSALLRPAMLISTES